MHTGVSDTDTGENGVSDARAAAGDDNGDSACCARPLGDAATRCRGLLGGQCGSNGGGGSSLSLSLPPPPPLLLLLRLRPLSPLPALFALSQPPRGDSSRCSPRDADRNDVAKIG